MPETSSSGPTPTPPCPFDIDCPALRLPDRQPDRNRDSGGRPLRVRSSRLYFRNRAVAGGAKCRFSISAPSSALQRVPSPSTPLIAMRVGAQAIGLAVDTVPNIHTTVGAWHPFPKGAVPEDLNPYTAATRIEDDLFWS